MKTNKYPSPLKSGEKVSEIFMRLASDWKSHTGHCQITYKSRTSKGDVLTYCLQDNGANCGGIRLMACSEDGEPSHEVNFSIIVNFEKPSDVFEGKEDKLCALACAWIDKNSGVKT